MSRVVDALFKEGNLFEKRDPNSKESFLGKLGIRGLNLGLGVLEAVSAVIKLPLRIAKRILDLVAGTAQNVMDVIAEPFENGRR